MPHGIVQPVEIVVMSDGLPPLHDDVVNDTVLLWSETLPAASRATTFSVNAVLQARPVTVVEVAGGLPVTVAMTVVPLRTSYAVTPTLSVEPVQLRLALLPLTFDAVSPPGAVGFTVSSLGSVVQIAWALLTDTLPAPSRPNTDSRYSVLGESPVRFFEVSVPGASASLLPSL